MSAGITEQDHPPSLDRTLALLAAFKGDNTAQQPSELARRLGIPRSSAYQIIRTLTLHGYLEQVSRGRVRLGPKFEALLFAYQNQHRTFPLDPVRRQKGLAGEGRSPTQSGMPWNLHLTETINCRRLYRPPPYRIGFSNASTRNPWRVAMLHATVNCAKRYSRRVSQFIISDAEDDAHKQSTDIEKMVRENIDLLLVSCNPAEAVDDALARASAAGVPVVVVDRRPASDESFLTYVSASDVALGRTTAQWLVEKIQHRGTIFLLAGMEGSSPTDNRVAAAKDVFALYPDVVVAPVRYTDWQEELGRDFTKRLVREYGVPAGVWCDSGLQGAGSMQAFIDLGIDDANIPPHTGGDINRVFQLAVNHHIPLAAVEYPAWMGARALEVGLDVLAGKTLPRHVEVRSQVVISRGYQTRSVHPDLYVDNYVRWDRPADFVPSHGLGDSYDPQTFEPV